MRGSRGGSRPTELSISVRNRGNHAWLMVVQQKIFTVLTGLQKQNKLNAQIQRSIRQAESLTEVEDLYAPYKPGHKGTLAERARALNLEPVAMACIQNSGNVKLNKHIKLGVKGKMISFSNSFDDFLLSFF